jgi:hypothetical protein
MQIETSESAGPSAVQITGLFLGSEREWADAFLVEGMVNATADTLAGTGTGTERRVEGQDVGETTAERGTGQKARGQTGKQTNKHRGNAKRRATGR